MDNEVIIPRRVWMEYVVRIKLALVAFAFGVSSLWNPLACVDGGWKSEVLARGPV